MKFFKTILATILGLFIFCFLSIFIFVGIIASSTGKEKVTIKEKSVLKLTLDQNIVETAQNSPFQDLNLPAGFGSDLNKVGLLQILQNIDKAKTDDNIKGIYLELSNVNGGFATLQAIRDKLIDFKTSGKFIIAYGEAISEKAYYLASVADEIMLYPSGGLEFNGLGAEINFYLGTMEKLGVKPEIFKVGDFKSAVEPFLRKDMSEQSREQTTSFLNSMYDYYLKNISESLQIPVEKLELISDSMMIQHPEDALKYGLVHKLAYEDEVLDRIKALVDTSGDYKKINFISLKKYSQVTGESESKYGKDRVAVIIAEGNIESGKSDGGVIGSVTVAAQIRKARLDDKVKAIVLRVNSPGGSALASDVMWREVMLAKKVKPVIASMGDVAASGGYYMSMACDTIVAYPNTITGSIGVFGMSFDISTMLEEKLGITTDRINTGEFSDIGSITRPTTDAEKQMIQTGVEEVYDEFTSKAAQGRGMNVEDLKKVASGRVWSGIEAKERGLVDVLGGLDVAIDLAAKAAGMDSSYAVKYYPEKKDFMEEFLKELKGETEAYLKVSTYGEMTPYIEKLKSLEKIKGIQTRMPFDIKDIK